MRNSEESGIRNQNPGQNVGIRNQESGIRNQNPGQNVGDPTNQESGIRNQMEHQE